MMKRLIVVLLALIVCAAVLTGCEEKITAEGIMLKVNENTKDAASMSANMSLAMDMSYDIEGVTGSLSMVMDMDMEMQLEPMAVYMNVAMTMDADGVTEEQTYEIYSVMGEKEGEVAVYTSMDDVWYVETAAADEYDSMKEQLTLAAGMAQNEDMTFELQEETVQINGNDAYVLSGTIKGETLQNMMASMQELESLLGTELDLGEAEAPLTYSVYKDTFMPAEMTIDMTSFMNDIMSTMGMSVESVIATFTYESFNESVVEVPEDVIANALDSAALEEDMTVSDEEYEEDVLINTDDTTVSMITSTPETALAMNEWGSTYTMLEDGTYFQVGVRIVGIERGEAVDNLVTSINDSMGSEVLGALHENLEYCLVGYEVYIPNDYPEESFSGIEMYLTDTEGMYFETEYEFDDMYWVEVVDDTNMYVGPGETAQVVGIFTMEKDRTEYLFEVGDSWFNEVYIHVTE